MKNQVESMNKYLPLETNLESMGFIYLIKKLIYTRDTNDLNPRHNKATAHMNLMNLYPEKFKMYRNSGISM